MPFFLSICFLSMNISCFLVFLESIDTQKESKSSYYPIPSSLSPEPVCTQSSDTQTEEGKKYIRTTISSPTLYKMPKVALSLRASLGRFDRF